MAGIGFLAPLFLLGALAVAIPLVLHLLRQRADPVQPFSAVKLLRAAPVEQARRRRLRDILLLALRVAALLLLAWGFARPFLRAEAAVTPPVTVVVADVSGSIGGPARTAQMRAAARAAVDAAPRGDAVALVQFAGAADTLVAPTLDRGAVSAATSQLTPGYGPTSYRSAFDSVAEVLAGRPGRVVVVTDLQAGGWSGGDPPALPSGTSVEVSDIGPPPPDVGVVAVSEQPGHVIAHIRATGEARHVRVSVGVDGVERASTTATAEEGTVDVSLPLQAQSGSRVRVQVDDPDGLPADDVRWLVSGTGRPARVTVIASPGGEGRDDLYVRRALLSLGGWRAVQVRMATADSLRSGPPEQADAVVLLGSAGMDRQGADRLASFVRDGGGLLVAVGPSVNPELLMTAFGAGLPRVRMRPAGDAGSDLAIADTRHPALALFSRRPGAFGDARFARAVALQVTDAGSVLARFDNGDAALVVTALGQGRVATFASDLSNRWNDFVLQPAFVPFLGELVHWLGGSSRGSDALIAGATRIAGADAPGVLSRPSDRGAAQRPVAVNVDPQEFDPARQPVAEFLAHVPRGGNNASLDPSRQAAQQEASQGLWRYGLGLMLLSLVVESLIGRRT